MCFFKSDAIIDVVGLFDTRSCYVCLCVRCAQWISRVKEFMEAGDEVDVEALQELLDETEGMPVAMEEADLLRCGPYTTPSQPISCIPCYDMIYHRTHIEALHWAAKAKPVLEKRNAKLSTLQRLTKEIAKYVSIWF